MMHLIQYSQMEGRDISIRSWRRLHRRKVLWAVAGCFALAAIGLALWYWLSPRIYEAKTGVMMDMSNSLRYGSGPDF